MCLLFLLKQAVIEANLILPLIQLLRHPDLNVKKEAAWAISNATTGGHPEQIQYVMSFHHVLDFVKRLSSISCVMVLGFFFLIKHKM